MFAAIYVGSSEISMKIFQVNGRKTFRQIDSVSRILELGRDTYREGKLSRESIKMICEELEGLKHKMEEYKITEYRAYATSAVREADNMDLVLDVIEHTTGIRVQVLSNSEQRYISFKGLVAKYSDFHQVVSKNTAFVDVGAGSVQISLFDKDALVTTQNIRMGSLRVRERLAGIQSETEHYEEMVEELIWHSSGTSPEDSMRSWQTM